MTVKKPHWVKTTLQCFWILLLLSSLSACTAPLPATPAHPTPSLLAFTPVVYFSTPTATIQPTPEPSLTATMVDTPTALAASTVDPTPSATFDTLRHTPPTLMLHPSNLKFDSVKFMQGFVKILKENQVHVVTYLDLTNQPNLSAREQGRLMIITIDDVALQAKIDPSVQEMIAILREAGYPGVLGITSEGKLADTETVATLKELAGEGWELANHTESHQNLHELEKVSVYGARLEIRTCKEKIQAATGVTPITLVLPYGDMVVDLKILYRENVQWVVGIVGGERYRTTNQVYYVGRDGPTPDPAQTYKSMLSRFR